MTVAERLAKGEETIRAEWAKLVEYRKRGKGQRLAKRLLGVKSKPMPEEVKERFKNATHAAGAIQSSVRCSSQITSGEGGIRRIGHGRDK